MNAAPVRNAHRRVQSKHCAPLPKLEMYPGECPAPEEAVGVARTNAVGEPIIQGQAPEDAASDEDVGTPVHIDRAGNDVTFGTGDNQDECQYALEDIDRVWTTECPGGGSPVPKYGQCGGTDWDGPTCCFGYSVCVKARPLSPPTHFFYFSISAPENTAHSPENRRAEERVLPHVRGRQRARGHRALAHGVRL